jgi:hypothetical protein
MIRSLFKNTRRALFGICAVVALTLALNAGSAKAQCVHNESAAVGAVAGAGEIALVASAVSDALFIQLSPLGVLAFGLDNNACKTGSMFKAAPVTIVQVEPGQNYRPDLFADMSKITPEPKFGAVASDLGNEQRLALMAQFNMATSTQYAAAR